MTGSTNMDILVVKSQFQYLLPTIVFLLSHVCIKPWVGK